jgi:redox-regulated HSP33 family molecular chaperone
MIQDGVIAVTCEFCNTQYVFAPAEVEAAEPGQSQPGVTQA